MAWTIVATAALLAVGIPGVMAISDRDACENSGGVYEKTQGTWSCTFYDPPGNNQGGVVKEDTTTGKGNDDSSHPQDEGDCVVNNGGTHC